jgi:hypothetical protein
MAEVVVAAIQFMIEVVGQAVLSIPFDCACRIRERADHTPFLVSLLFLIVGGLVGWISIYFVPSFGFTEFVEYIGQRSELA